MPPKEQAKQAEASARRRDVAKPEPSMSPASARLLRLQRDAGNHAVTALLASDATLQRQRAPAPGRTRAPRNDARRLQDAVAVEQLFGLYATHAARFVIGPMPPSNLNPYYTRTWIRGAGQQAIRSEITARVSGLDERSRLGYLNYIENSMHQRDFDSARKLWLRDQVGATLPLTYDQRIELRRVVGDRMNDAYTDYTAAAQTNAASIKAAVNAEAAVWALFVDVFMGLAAPGISRGIAALAANIPAAASNVTYRVALAALDTTRTGLLLAAATKVGKETIKLRAQPLFGQSDTDLFIQGLRAAFRAGTDAVNLDLPNQTDEALGVLAATFDPSVSNEAHYMPKIRDLVDRFRRQVQPIGPPRSTNVTDPVDRRVTSQTGLVWALRGRELILTQVNLTRSSLDPGSRMYFRTFIDRDLRHIAEDKAAVTQPRGVQEVPTNVILGFPDSVPTTAARR